MSKLLKLICLATVLMLFTGCKGDDPEPVQETWQMTYDDYHSVLMALSPAENEKYKDFSCNVTVVRDGNEISIKGLFAEYPDAWIKGTVKGNMVFIGNSQPIATDNGETVYFHWGYAESDGHHNYSEHYTNYYISFGPGSGPAFIISNDGQTMTNSYPYGHNAIWYNKADWGFFEYNSCYRDGKQEGTGYPDEDIKINIVLRKVTGDSSGKAN